MSALPAVPAPSPIPCALGTLAIRPWPDEVIDALGHDPRSSYVERFWLGVLGPTTTWLMRRLAAGLETSPSGFDLPLESTARALGLSHTGGRNSPFMRSLARCVQFGLAQPEGDEVLAVRRKIPPLNRRQVGRLPDDLQRAHDDWQRQQLQVPAHEQLRRRSRQLALSLLELGEDLEGTERQLLRWRFHPAMARESSAWAWARHRSALEAAGGG